MSTSFVVTEEVELTVTTTFERGSQCTTLTSHNDRTAVLLFDPVLLVVDNCGPHKTTAAAQEFEDAGWIVA